MGVPPGAPISIEAANPSASLSTEMIYLAQDEGLFAANGLNAQIPLVAGPSQIAAMGTGEIQFGMLGATEVANADLAGQDIVMIATISDLPIFLLFAQAKYATIQDLAGQSISITTAGSTTDATAQMFLARSGMTGKVSIVAAQTAAGILAATTNGFSAAGIISAANAVSASKAGLHELANGVTFGVPLNHDVIAVTRSYLQTNPDTVERFLTAYQQAWNDCADPAKAPVVEDVLKQHAGATADDASYAQQTMQMVCSGKAIPDVGLEGVQNALNLSSDPQAQSADPTKWIDNSLIDSLPHS